ncbi:hypothetical protein [Chelatococcus sp. CO-6]|uniref:hypothetical protein n=1 Tax=Chelatococcus sp. CO-6 TaxID=1702325 RepID=UPI0012E27BA0|nr:hypothetical protein [Chelatococcus sp. CO-6]
MLDVIHEGAARLARSPEHPESAAFEEPEGRRHGRLQLLEALDRGKRAFGLAGEEQRLHEAALHAHVVGQEMLGEPQQLQPPAVLAVAAVEMSEGAQEARRFLPLLVQATPPMA